jgi:DHA1 family bicyclomycin/chloramphenicol resistance-like MFS transporter
MQNRKTLAPEGVVHLLFLGALAALAPVATDMALPAISTIASGLSTTPSRAGLTLGLFMFGFAAGPIVYGPLADRRGRRPALLAGLTLFVLASIACAATPSIWLLLVARVVQGAGAGAGMTLAFAMVRDLFEGQAAQSRMAVITIVANVAPILSPALGTLLLAVIGWRGIYLVILAYGCLLALIAWRGIGETLPSLRRSGRSAGSETDAAMATPVGRGADSPRGAGLLANYAALARHAEARAHMLVNALGFAWMFAYVSASPLVLLERLKVSGTVYAAMFACTGLGIVVGATLGERLSRRGMRGSTLILAGIVLAIVASFGLLAIGLSHSETLMHVMPMLVMATFAFGLVAPNAAHGALAPLPQIAGQASGVMTSVQMIGGAIASVVVVMLFPHLQLAALSSTMGVASLLALLVYLPICVRGTKVSHA